jgi:hypothetical protein
MLKETSVFLSVLALTGKDDAGKILPASLTEP